MNKAELSAWFLNRFNRWFHYFSFWCGRPVSNNSRVDIAQQKFAVALLREGHYKHKHFSNSEAPVFAAFIARLLTFNLLTQPVDWQGSYEGV